MGLFRPRGQEGANSRVRMRETQHAPSISQRGSPRIELRIEQRPVRATACRTHYFAV